MPDTHDLKTKTAKFIDEIRKNLLHYIRTHARTYIRAYIRTYIRNYIRTYISTYIVAYMLLIFVGLSFTYIKVGHSNFILLSHISGRILLTDEPVISILKEFLAPEIEKDLQEAYEKEKAKLEAELEAEKAKLKAELEEGKKKLKQELQSEIDSLIDSDDNKKKLKEAEKKLKKLFK